jgi:hypothetical protein
LDVDGVGCVGDDTVDGGGLDTAGLDGTDRSGVELTGGAEVPDGSALVSVHPTRAAASTTAPAHRPTITGT